LIEIRIRIRIDISLLLLLLLLLLSSPDRSDIARKPSSSPSLMG